MECSICYKPEVFRHQGKKKIYHTGPKVKSFICSSCTQKLLRVPREKLLEVHGRISEKGNVEKAALLESLI